jgi:hypothetical protein
MGFSFGESKTNSSIEDKIKSQWMKKFGSKITPDQYKEIFDKYQRTGKLNIDSSRGTKGKLRNVPDNLKDYMNSIDDKVDKPKPKASGSGFVAAPDRRPASSLRNDLRGVALGGERSLPSPGNRITTMQPAVVPTASSAFTPHITPGSITPDPVNGPINNMTPFEVANREKTAIDAANGDPYQQEVMKYYTSRDRDNYLNTVDNVNYDDQYGDIAGDRVADVADTVSNFGQKSADQWFADELAPDGTRDNAALGETKMYFPQEHFQRIENAKNKVKAAEVSAFEKNMKDSQASAFAPSIQDLAFNSLRGYSDDKPVSTPEVDWMDKDFTSADDADVVLPKKNPKTGKDTVKIPKNPYKPAGKTGKKSAPVVRASRPVPVAAAKPNPVQAAAQRYASVDPLNLFGNRNGVNPFGRRNEAVTNDRFNGGFIPKPVNQ